MKKIFLFFIIFIFITLSLDPQNNNTDLSDEFKKIITIDELNKKLIDLNLSEIDYRDYFYYYCLVSEELNRYNEFTVWFNKIEDLIDKDLYDIYKRTDAKNFNFEKQKKFTEDLLIVLHDRIFKRYDFNSNRISLIVDWGQFNCVSSSILYALFLKKYGFNPIGVETQDHVFIKIIFNNNESIDVETTNKYGFNPGEKKDVLDEFGKVTGFNYVPPKDYRNRNDIDIKKLLFIVYHNLSEDYFKKGEYIRSANLGYLIYQGRKDDKGKNDFYIFFNNYIAKLANGSDYVTAIKAINSYIQFIEWNNNFINIRFDLLMSYINAWNDFGNYKAVKDFIDKQNNMFSSIKDDNKYIEVYFFYTYKLINYYNSLNKYNDSYSLIKEFKFKYDDEKIQNLFGNILIDETNHYKDDFNLINERLNKLKLEFPEYSEIIYKFEINNYINKINNMLKVKNYPDALNEAKKTALIFPEEQKIKNILLNCYINYTVFLYKSDSLNDIIFYTEEALKKFPNDRTLKSNYLAFFKNFINRAIEAKDYSRARKLLNTAKEKFPNDSYLLEIEKFLESKRY